MIYTDFLKFDFLLVFKLIGNCKLYEDRPESNFTYIFMRFTLIVLISQRDCRSDRCISVGIASAFVRQCRRTRFPPPRTIFRPPSGFTTT